MFTNKFVNNKLFKTSMSIISQYKIRLFIITFIQFKYFTKQIYAQTYKFILVTNLIEFIESNFF